MGGVRKRALVVGERSDAASTREEGMCYYVEHFEPAAWAMNANTFALYDLGENKKRKEAKSKKKKAKLKQNKDSDQSHHKSTLQT